MAESTRTPPPGHDELGAPPASFPSAGDELNTPPARLPEPELEHPQQHPGESTPPESATDQVPSVPSMPPAPADELPEPKASDTAFATGFDAVRGYADQGGGIIGGAMPQGWGEGWKGPTGDAMPAEVGLADIMRDGAHHWDQWVQRPLGADQK